MNYTEITNAIKEYTDNTETTFVNNIPNFVRQTEERIYRSILIPELRKNVTTSLTTSNRFLAKPTDFLAHQIHREAISKMPNTILDSVDAMTLRNNYTLKDDVTTMS